MNVLSLPPTLLAFIAIFPSAYAQYPFNTTFQNVLSSPVDPNVTVAYKTPDAGTCTTAFSTQKQYTGYISIPPFTLAPIQQNYSVNTFFWFIEARQAPETAPLTIWLSGGPGTSSMFGLFNEVGPCKVVQMSDGSYGTDARPFGWDRASNLLFIDQPNLVGFSYDIATNASFDLFAMATFEPPTTPNPDLPPYMFLNGTFGTANQNSQTFNTANTTQIAAAATWHFLQTWLSTFTQYNPSTRPNVTSPGPNEPAGINLFTESYGGKYGPVFAAYFEHQNKAIISGNITGNNTVQIQLQSIGIINGIVDNLIQDYYYPYFAYNNTYGIEIISLTEEINAINNYTSRCLPSIQACRAANDDIYGDNAHANQLCETAQLTCNPLAALAGEHGFDPYDIRQKYPSPDPSAAYQEYLNEASVLASIGARVNYTESNRYVQDAFISTGDIARAGMIQDLVDLLQLGVRVALIYGDADYLVNWYGGQAVAFAIANTPPNLLPPPTGPAPGAVSYASGFASAGYADIVVNDTYVGGATRQYGNLSFSRVYNAGHFVPYFQPETAFQIFARVIFGNDISTGEDINLSSFESNGTANATYTNTVPPTPAPTCWVRNWNDSCSLDDTNSMMAGHGLVSFGIFYQDTSAIVLQSTIVAAGVPGSPITSSLATGTGGSRSASTTRSALTGFYTATGTPKSSKSTAPTRLRPLDITYGPALVLLGGFMLGVVVATSC